MKIIFFVLFFMVGTYQFALGDELAEVEELLKENVEKVISVLQDKTLDLKERNQKVVNVINATFDFQLMARLSLQKKYWMNLTEEQKKEFTDLFVNRLQDSYVEKLDLYSDEKVEFEPPKKVKKNIHFLTYLVSKDSRYSMLYKVYQSKKGWKVYDLEIQGVSVIHTFRTQFDGVLREGTIADLLEKLKSHDFNAATAKQLEEAVN